MSVTITLKCNKHPNYFPVPVFSISDIDCPSCQWIYSTAYPTESENGIICFDSDGEVIDIASDFDEDFNRVTIVVKKKA